MTVAPSAVRTKKGKTMPESLDPNPTASKRFIVYVPVYANDRYENLYNTVTASTENAGVIRKMVSMTFDEAKDVAKAWARGDNAWITKWQEFDEERREWYKKITKEEDTTPWYAKKEKSVRSTGPFFEPPPEVSGEPDKAILPITEVRRSKLKVPYRLWLKEGSPKHLEIIQYAESLTDREKRDGIWQMLLRISLVIAVEDPRIRDIIRDM